MAKKRGNFSRGAPKPPPDADEGALLVQKYMIGRFDKKDGRAADWPTIADALFRAAFTALKEIPEGHPAADKLLKIVHDGAYNRLVKNEAESPAKAFGEVNAPPPAETAPSIRQDFKP